MNQSKPNGPTWRILLIVLTMGAAIIAMHFHGLLSAPMNDVMWGISISADPVGDIHLVNDFLSQLARGCTDHITSHSFPFGQIGFLGPSRYLGSGFIILAILTKITGMIIYSFNFTIMLLMLLNFVVSYFASRILLKDNITAIIPATLVTFSAYSYSHSWAHIGLIPIFYFPCFFAAFTELQEGYRTTRRIIIASVWLAASIYATPYYCYFNLWMAVAILAGYLKANPRSQLTLASIKTNAICGVFALCLMIPFIYFNFFQDMSNAWYQAPAQNYGNSLYFLTNYSARPSDYVLPFVHNRFFGQFFRPFIADANNARNYWSDELPISIGVLPTACLVLIIGALVTKKSFNFKKIKSFSEFFFALYLVGKSAASGIIQCSIVCHGFLVLLKPATTPKLFRH